MKPRCFGLPSCIHRDAPHCAKCPVLDDCERYALSKALALSRYIELKDVVARLRHRTGTEAMPAAIEKVAPMVRTTRDEKLNMALTTEDALVVKQIPAKVRKKVEALMKQGKDVEAREALARGENPFPLVGAGYLHVACKLLLEGGFTRKELKEAYKTTFGWTEGTAGPHVSSIVWIFPALGLARQVNKRFERVI